MIITIDGPAGTGKSTVARLVSEQLGFLHLDTGAFYRSITYAALSEGIDTEDQSAMAEFARLFPPQLEFREGIPHYIVSGKDTTDFIRSLTVTQRVSKVATYPEVRRSLIKVQREVVRGLDVVSEGRDMGSNVFPHAELKIYLTASAEIRAQRRYTELSMKGGLPPETTFASILEDIEKRDYMDSTRAVNPLQIPTDAQVIDTSEMSIEAVVQSILALVQKNQRREESPLS